MATQKSYHIYNQEGQYVNTIIATSKKEAIEKAKSEKSRDPFAADPEGKLVAVIDGPFEKAYTPGWSTDVCGKTRE